VRVYLNIAEARSCDISLPGRSMPSTRWRMEVSMDAVERFVQRRRRRRLSLQPLRDRLLLLSKSSADTHSSALDTPAWSRILVAKPDSRLFDSRALATSFRKSCEMCRLALSSNPASSVSSNYVQNPSFNTVCRACSGRSVRALCVVSVLPRLHLFMKLGSNRYPAPDFVVFGTN